MKFSSSVIFIASLIGYSRGATLRGTQASENPFTAVTISPLLCSVLDAALLALGDSVKGPFTPAGCFEAAALVQEVCRARAVEGDLKEEAECRAVAAKISSTCIIGISDPDASIEALSIQLGCDETVGRRNLESLTCTIVSAASHVLISGAIESKVGCGELATEAALTCETFGGGPEDPFADACAGIIGGAGFAACEAAVDKGTAFTADDLDSAVGC